MVSDQKQNAFKDWLRQQGGYVNPKVDLFHQLPSGDRGVYATADIEEGEQLLLVPVSSTLHLDVTDARGIHLAPTCSKELADFLTQHQQPAATAAGTNKTAGGKGQQRKPFSPFLATTLMLMSELSHGDDSSHTPYFNTLPEATTCLLNWTTEEQQLLAGTSLSDVTRSIRDIYEADIAPVLATRPDLFPPGRVSYESFRRAADMVQTRAFHMSADNWITGAHQESTDELYLIPAIDMLNHSTQPSLRNTSLALCHGEVEVTLSDGHKKSFTNFFSMRAEKAIPAGTQVLHTYGDLSDAQLLQTYGFIDVTPQQQQQQQQEEEEGSEQQQQQQLSANPHNYVVLHIGDLLASANVVAAAAKVWPAKKAKQVAAKRLQHLAAVGLLQQQQPEASQLMVTASNTLPDELLTIVQVLMMTESEFKQLQEAEQEEQQERAAAAAAADGSSEQQEQQQEEAVHLNLGRDMLEDEFGELCGAVLLQAVDRWCSRYPLDLKASLVTLQGSEAGSKPWLAAAVAVGEQLLLQQLKKEALMIMLGAAQGEEEEGEEEELGSEDDMSEEMSEDESADDVSSDEDDTTGDKHAKKAAAAAGSKKKRSRQEPEAAAQQPQEDPKHSGKHSSKHGSKHKHGDKQHHKKHKKGGKDDRPHFGDMTGPAEADVWQSDDSDKVGYSSSSSEDEGERHPADPSEHHTYEVGAAGAVREAHGHMLGPDEAALLESDDSDKVGYADEAAAETAAAAAAAAETAAAAAETAATAAGGSGGKRGRQAAMKAGGSSGGSKKPKRGLGYKG